MHLPPYGDEFRRTGAFFSSLQVMPSSEPDMHVQINEGGFWLKNKEWVEFVGGRSPGFTAPTIGAKWTILCLHYTGAAMLIDGDPGSDPELPVLERKSFPLAVVYLQAGDTKITGDKIFDVRNLWGSTSYSHVDLDDRNYPGSHSIESIENLREELDNRASDNVLNNLLDSKADINGTVNDVFVLNKDFVGTPSSHVGFEVERGTENNAAFRFNEQLNVWEYSNNGSDFVQLTNEGPSVTLPTASDTVLGGIKVGSRLNMNPTTQLLSATLQSTNDFTDFYKNKLNDIEDGATADMTPTSVKFAYEANSDTNAFTDADRTKLDSVEDGATAGNMSPADIKTSYESNINTNVFTDLEKIKLANSEDNSTDDMTDLEIKTAYENNPDTNPFDDAEKAKLATVEVAANNYVHPTTHTSVMIVEDENHRFVTDIEKASWNNKAATADYWSKAELVATGGSSDRIDWTHIQNIPAFGSADWLSPVADIAARDALTPTPGQCVLVQDDGDGKSAQYAYNGTQWSKIADVDWIPMTDLQVKTSYEANADTNEFSDAEKTKLGGIEAGANAYSLTIATDSVLGGITVGTGLQVDGAGEVSLNYSFDDIEHGDRTGGTLHALVSGSSAGFISVADKAKLDAIEASANNYSLPVSTTVGVGGVKTGSHLWMDVDDTINVTEANNSGGLGVVGVNTGSNIDIDPGTHQISVADADVSTPGVVTVGSNIAVSSGTISVPHAQGSNLGLVIAGTNISLDDGSGTISVPIADDTTPGVIRIGSGIEISNGIVSVDWNEMTFTDIEHGSRSGGNLHSTATTIVGGFMSAADKLKLDGVESGATADMIPVEIKSAYELNPDTNAFTDSEVSKLSGIEAGATADMDATEIKTSYESNSDTNALTDALLTKLNGVEASANAYVHPTSHDSITIDHPITTELIVDGNRVDSYTADGSLGRPFKTITAAIGVVSGGTLISVAPGTYVENLTIEAGMHFVCKSPEKNNICTVSGTVSYSTSNTSGGANGNISSFCGIDIFSDGSNPTVQFYGSNPQRLNLINCEVDSSGLQPALHMNNTGADSLVVTEDANFNNTGSGMAAIVDYGKLSQWKSRNNSQSNSVSVQFNNTSQLDSFLSYFTGQLSFSGTSGGIAIHPVIDAGANDAIVMNGSTLTLTVPFSLGSGALIDAASTGTVSNETVAEASKIDYAPTTSGDWTGSPTEVLSALDELAGRPSGGVSWNYTATMGGLPGSPSNGEMWFVGDVPNAGNAAMPVWWNSSNWVSATGAIVDGGGG